MARSYQITSVFNHLTVRENLSLAIQAHNGHSFRFWRRAAADPLICRTIGPALARVGLEARARVPAANLSHGERRQLEVGMALCGEPKLLLLDEPHAGIRLVQQEHLRIANQRHPHLQLPFFAMGKIGR